MYSLIQASTSSRLRLLVKAVSTILPLSSAIANPPLGRFTRRWSSRFNERPRRASRSLLLGVAFVQPEDGSKDVFVHVSALERAGIHGLNEGDKITFVLEDDRRGRGKQAAQVELA